MVGVLASDNPEPRFADAAILPDADGRRVLLLPSERAGRCPGGKAPKRTTGRRSTASTPGRASGWASS